jgi:hypothetical protein
MVTVSACAHIKLKSQHNEHDASPWQSFREWLNMIWFLSLLGCCGCALSRCVTAFAVSKPIHRPPAARVSARSLGAFFNIQAISAPMARFRNGQDFGIEDISLDFGRFLGFWAIKGQNHGPASLRKRSSFFILPSSFTTAPPAKPPAKGSYGRSMKGPPILRMEAWPSLHQRLHESRTTL